MMSAQGGGTKSWEDLYGKICREGVIGQNFAGFICEPSLGGQMTFISMVTSIAVLQHLFLLSICMVYPRYLTMIMVYLRWSLGSVIQVSFIIWLIFGICKFHPRYLRWLFSIYFRYSLGPKLCFTAWYFYQCLTKILKHAIDRNLLVPYWQSYGTHMGTMTQVFI